MKVEILPDAVAACRRAAERLADLIRARAGARPRFVMALSGGTTPWPMLDDLAAQALDWRRVHIVQTDERLVGPDDPARNLAQLRAHLVSHVPLASDQVHAMPVDAEPPEDGAARYAALLAELAGTPPVLDVVHLGLGSDGHTASLVPGDPVLDIVGQDVATSAAYGGCRRMTLTVPAINRSRNVLWLVTGAGKAEAFARLLDADPAMPAARIERRRAVVVADRAAARATLRQG